MHHFGCIVAVSIACSRELIMPLPTGPRKRAKTAPPSPPGPARKLVEVSPHRTTGGAYIEGLTPWHAEHESYLEKHTIAALSLCHDITEIKSQGIEHHYQTSNGENRRYTPDFVVTQVAEARPVNIEVKALPSLSHEEAVSKYQEIAKHFRSKNEIFIFITDVQLFEEPRFKNVKLLYRYVTSHIPEHILLNATTALSSGPMKISEILKNTNLELVDIYTLIAKRKICFEWSAPLGSNTPISLPSQPFEGLTLETIINSSRYSRLLAELAMGRHPTDKQLLANAKALRLRRSNAGPQNYVGGDIKQPPLRDRREEELPRGTAWDSRDRTPGLHILSIIKR